ncbi:MAG TPA: hypothetical protein VF516_28470, partial [Kofleriaceae bacterium]
MNTPLGALLAALLLSLSAPTAAASSDDPARRRRAQGTSSAVTAPPDRRGRRGPVLGRRRLGRVSLSGCEVYGQKIEIDATARQLPDRRAVTVTNVARSDARRVRRVRVRRVRVHR